MEYVMPSIVETQCTGWVGSVEQLRGGVKYVAQFIQAPDGICVYGWRNDKIIPLNHNATIARLVAAGSRTFIR